MQVYIINNGDKTLFYQGRISKDVIKQIKAWIKWYFGWKQIKYYKEDSKIYLMNGDRIKQLRRDFFKKEGVVA